MSIVSLKIDSHYDYVAKVVLVGDSNVGKSNLLGRFISNEFTTEKKPTLGVEFGTKIIVSHDKLIKVQIWDTAGQEKYKSITNSYYVHSKGAIVVFDISVKSSFDSIEKWVHDVLEISGNNIPLLLLGNKCDLTELRKVSYDEGLNKAKKLNMTYFETSALDGINVNEAFQAMTDNVFTTFLSKLNLDEDDDYRRSNILTEEKEKKSCSC